MLGRIYIFLKEEGEDIIAFVSMCKDVLFFILALRIIFQESRSSMTCMNAKQYEVARSF